TARRRSAATARTGCPNPTKWALYLDQRPACRRGRRLHQKRSGRGDMSEEFDFIVVGGGSAGAVIASRLSEDPACRVALIEAGDRPPEISALPIAPPLMQLNPATDWMYTADPGKAGLGLNGGRVPVPRGKMLGGSSG